MTQGLSDTGAIPLLSDTQNAAIPKKHLDNLKQILQNGQFKKGKEGWELVPSKFPALTADAKSIKATVKFFNERNQSLFDVIRENPDVQRTLSRETEKHDGTDKGKKFSALWSEFKDLKEHALPELTKEQFEALQKTQEEKYNKRAQTYRGPDEKDFNIYKAGAGDCKAGTKKSAATYVAAAPAAGGFAADLRPNGQQESAAADLQERRGASKGLSRT